MKLLLNYVLLSDQIVSCVLICNFIDLTLIICLFLHELGIVTRHLLVLICYL